MPRVPVWVALFLAAMTAVLLAWAGILTWAAAGYYRDRPQVVTAGALHLLFFFALFGIPLAYATLLAGYLTLVRLVRATRPLVLISMGTFTGALVMTLSWRLFWGGLPAFDPMSLVVGAVAGAGSSALFAVIGLPIQSVGRAAT